MKARVRRTAFCRIKALGRSLRKNQTDAEAFLWGILRDRRFFELKFRRQHAIGPFIVDFYCHRARLAIELDGGQHDEAENVAHDRKRDAHLGDKGIRVLRFWNNEFLENTEGVLLEIARAVSPELLGETE